MSGRIMIIDDLPALECPSDLRHFAVRNRAESV
jgi:hypothetical protein